MSGLIKKTMNFRWVDGDEHDDVVATSRSYVTFHYKLQQESINLATSESIWEDIKIEHSPNNPK